ncbi:efflux RND transporter periplasmic adaptor subunit [Variovorax sp. AFSI2.2]|uniref:efflux RND transporter periplasmic adaptor subunit n=1 Tax=Variovorax sp. AFSI2.2 TaxID=3384160 RepID=UPI003EBA0BC4
MKFFSHSSVRLCGLIAILVLAGCGGNVASVAAPPRAVKLETVGMSALAETRFAAVVRQEQRADLAFEGGGRIAAIGVDVGDRVRKGQVLARLDPEPARLRMQQADANASSTMAEFEERKTQLRQQQAMFDDGAISSATLTTSRVAFEAAQSRSRVADSDRDLARRALRQVDIRAPFDGSVVARLLQPQTDAGAGQAVLQLEGQGHAQVVALLPANVASTLAAGASATGYRSNAPDKPLALQLRSVSTRLEGAATVQAIFDLPAQEEALRSGESLLLALPAAPTELTVPLTAVVPTSEKDAAVVFVYEPQIGHVQRRAVVSGSIEGARMHVRQGLAPGEKVVSAGASFLTNGQAVTVFRPETRLSGGTAQ